MEYTAARNCDRCPISEHRDLTTTFFYKRCLSKKAVTFREIWLAPFSPPDNTLNLLPVTLDHPRLCAVRSADHTSAVGFPIALHGPHPTTPPHWRRNKRHNFVHHHVAATPAREVSPPALRQSNPVTLGDTQVLRGIFHQLSQNAVLAVPLAYSPTFNTSMSFPLCRPTMYIGSIVAF